MTRILLLEQLKAFTLEATKNIILPVQMQEEDTEPPAPRPVRVFLTRLPDGKVYMRDAPYILHQVVTCKDVHQPGRPWPDSSAVVRSVFCVYHPDEQEGGLALLNLMERMRIALMQQVVIGKQFTLNLQEGLESLIYPENSAPFYAGEMISQWKLKSVERKLTQWQET